MWYRRCPLDFTPAEGVILKEQVLGDGIGGESRAESVPPEAGAEFRSLLQKLPAGAYTCDPEGLITSFNQSAVQLWGRAPALNDPSDRFCGSFKLFSLDGSPIAHDQCWMAMALKMDKGCNGREIVIERPDGQRLTALAHANPIHDESGKLLGALNVLVNVTERRRAEQEWDRIFALSPDLLCVASLDGYFKRINLAFEETLGYTGRELLAKPFIELVHPDDHAATLGEVEKLGTGAPTLHFENRYLHKDGTHVWLAWKAVPVVEEGLVYAAARDITEQKRAEAELRKAKLFARSTLNSLSANIAILDESGKIVFVNSAWREFGASNNASVTAGIAEGANYLEVCDEATGEDSDTAAAFAEGIRDVVSGRREAFELEYPCHFPTEERWFVGRVTRFPDTHPPKIVVAHENITERKRVEEDLRESEGHLRFVLEAGSLGSWKLDLSTGEMESSGICKTNFGLPLDADLSYEALRSMIHPDDRDSMREAVERAIATGTDYEADYRITTPGGEVRWIAARGRLVYAPDGAPLRIAGITLDITKRKRAEEEIRTRARQQAAVAELGQRALARSDLPATMDEAVAMLARILDAEFCEVLQLLPEGDALLLRAGVGWEKGLVGEATVGAGLDSQAGYTLRSSGPVIVEELRTEERFSGSPLLREHGVVSGMTVVIPGRDGPFGVLGAHTTERRTFTQDDVNFFQAAANVLATAVERKKAEEELHEIREVERQRIARDMHDEALQDLTYVLAETQFIQSISEDPRLDDRLQSAVEALKRAGRGVRAAIFDLRLGEDESVTFVERLESLVDLNRRYSPECEIGLLVEEDFSPPLAETQQAELLRIIQEALANVRRHSGARRVRVAVGISEGRLWAEVSDDGRGFDRGTPDGQGTRGMRERARALGGDLEIKSKPGEGTKARFKADLGRDARKPEARTHVLLVEDHASLRQAVAAMFDREPGFTVVGQAGSLAQARGMLERADVAVIDLGLPDGHGGELIKEMREVNPRAMALVLSAYSDKTEVARAVEAGAAGVLHKSAEMGEVVDAVRRLRAGESLLPLDEVVELLRFASSRRDQEHEVHQAVARLTPREKEVLGAVAEGLDGREIARRLHISLQTERNHMANILGKLGVNSRLQALVFALRHGLVEVAPSHISDVSLD